MQRVRLLWIIGLWVTVTGGCGGGHTGSAKSSPSPSVAPSNRSALPAAEGGGDFSRAPAGAAPAAAERMATSGAAKMATTSREGEGPVPVVGDTSPTTTPKQNIQSGVLTAGSFDDNLNPAPFRAFAGKIAQNREVRDLPAKLAGHRLVVTVKGQDGHPVGNATVTIAAANGKPAVDLVTRSDGRVVFISSWDQVPADGEFIVTVQPPDGSRPVKQTVPRTESECAVKLPSVASELPSNLDLALVIDTTGSMGDELEYLKAEIKDIAEAVHTRFPEVNQRFALVVYRDQGDEYVSRQFDFTASIDEFQSRLATQRAGGGGDIPEAVHKALEDATQLTWRSDRTARVLFLVADAPPHAEFAERTMTAANALRKQGIAMYPVACSGTTDAAEFIFRTCALLSGSQYIFLTDDSGVGNAHAEPHFPFYNVERLDRLMVRMIASELSGRRLEPAPAEIIRTVGQPQGRGTFQN